MRTTLNLDDGLVRAAKQRALHDETTLTRIIERALSRYLQEGIAEPTARYDLKLHVTDMGLLPGVDLDDRDALYDAMDDAS